MLLKMPSLRRIKIRHSSHWAKQGTHIEQKKEDYIEGSIIGLRSSKDALQGYFPKNQPPTLSRKKLKDKRIVLNML